MSEPHFYHQDPRQLAAALLGKLLQRRWQGHWLGARIIETEAYLLEERASHASLGWTQSRRALFMEPGTLYMYYARGGDSLNISAAGEGNGVLIKSALAHAEPPALALMQQLNPATDGTSRAVERLCAGQTLLCRALQLKVPEWNARRFDPQEFRLIDDGYRPTQIIRTTRLGIPEGRDGHLPYRFVDAAHARYCTRNPLRRGARAGIDYQLFDNPDDAWKNC